MTKTCHMLVPEALEVLDAALTLLASSNGGSLDGYPDWEAILIWIDEQSTPLARLVRKRRPLRTEIMEAHSTGNDILVRSHAHRLRLGIESTRSFLECVSALPYVEVVSEAAQVELLVGKDFE